MMLGIFGILLLNISTDLPNSTNVNSDVFKYGIITRIVLVIVILMLFICVYRDPNMLNDYY